MFLLFTSSTVALRDMIYCAVAVTQRFTVPTCVFISLKANAILPFTSASSASSFAANADVLFTVTSDKRPCVAERKSQIALG